MRNVAEMVETTQRVTLALVGLGPNDHRAQLAEQALRGLGGVRYVYVCPATEMAYVVYDGSQVRPEQFVAAVENAGLRAGTPELR